MDIAFYFIMTPLKMSNKHATVCVCALRKLVETLHYMKTKIVNKT